MRDENLGGRWSRPMALCVLLPWSLVLHGCTSVGDETEAAKPRALDSVSVESKHSQAQDARRLLDVLKEDMTRQEAELAQLKEIIAQAHKERRASQRKAQEELDRLRVVTYQTEQAEKASRLAREYADCSIKIVRVAQCRARESKKNGNRVTGGCLASIALTAITGGAAAWSLVGCGLSGVVSHSLMTKCPSDPCERSQRVRSVRMDSFVEANPLDLEVMNHRITYGPGVKLTSLKKKSALYKSGIRVGDTVHFVGNLQIDDRWDLVNLAQKLRRSEGRVVVVFGRNGALHQAELSPKRLRALRKRGDQWVDGVKNKGLRSYAYGVEVVADLHPKKAFEAGDYWLYIDGEFVRSVDHFKEILFDKTPGVTAQLSVRRKGKTNSVMREAQ